MLFSSSLWLLSLSLVLALYRTVEHHRVPLPSLQPTLGQALPARRDGTASPPFRQGDDWRCDHAWRTEALPVSSAGDNVCITGTSQSYFKAETAGLKAGCHLLGQVKILLP